VIIIELSYRIVYRDNFDLSYRLSIGNSIWHIVTALAYSTLQTVVRNRNWQLHKSTSCSGQHGLDCCKLCMVYSSVAMQMHIIYWYIESSRNQAEHAIPFGQSTLMLVMHSYSNGKPCHWAIYT